MTEPAAVDPATEPPRAYTLETNADGSAVVKLREPVKWKDEPLARLFIPRVTGRHMQAATWRLFEVPTLGQVMAWANGVVEPVGVLDELDAVLARDLATEVALILAGKSQATGARPSPL